MPTPQQECDAWNAAHEPGTRVKVQLGDRMAYETVTRSRAWVWAGAGGAVVMLEGVSGVCPLDRIEPAGKQKEEGPMGSFFLVWGEGRLDSRVRHASLADAKREAERMAGLHPGTKFYVLKAYGFAQKVEASWTTLDDPDIPF